MRNIISAVYEDGILRPLQPLELKEGEKVILTISPTQSITSSESTHEILNRISFLAYNQEGDNFSGENHDKEIYKQ